MPIAHSRPNVLFITSHDVGRHLGVYGIDSVRSPRLDTLARQGTLIRRAFCSAPSCSPSRASIFTGRWPHSNGVMGLCHADFAWDLHDDERHLAAILRDAGYTTAGLGVIHEAARKDRLGFDRILPVKPGKSRPTNGDGVAASAIEALRELAGGDKPFYFQVGFFEPHRVQGGFGHPPDDARGVHVPPFLIDSPTARQDLADFQGAIKALDDAVGAMLDALDQLDIAKNTIVIFTADHGIPFPRAKCSLYDPGLEVALMLRWPGGPWLSGETVESMVSNIDILPTLLETLNIAVPANVQGQSFAWQLRGEAASPTHQPRREIFGEMTYHDYCDPRRCIRTETHKLIVNFTCAPAFMDPSQAWVRKTITRTPPEPAYAYHPPIEIYDLRADPLETKNLADAPEHAATRRELLDRLHRWMSDTGDPLLQGIPAPPMHTRVIAELRGG